MLDELQGLQGRKWLLGVAVEPFAGLQPMLRRRDCAKIGLRPRRPFLNSAHWGLELLQKWASECCQWKMAKPESQAKVEKVGK